LCAIGDFDGIMESSENLSKVENYVYWIIWLFIVTSTCIIFLNVIIAEASASYQKVVDTLESVIGREKCALIQESEEMGSK